MLDLDPSEKIILKVRCHKLVLFFESFFLIFFLVLPPILFWAGERAILIKGNNIALFLGIYSAILLIAWIIFFIIWTNYYLDVLLVTDKRIIDVEQRGFFSREISTVRLENIEDITINVSGVLATFLNYGTLKIQTAAEAREFIIHDVPEPNMVKSTIYDLHNKQAEAPKLVKVVS
ncbi:MAG: hypothetical protein A3J46_04475 [Candidatus Yanofskybacteria bacterium RIFCSPHIGHO2_02_FULL_41_11]|uniref:YdbS-like PH domain-containing protein n=1 Tax=Candidatus Yanofskybacteria bacterium RIFCSPHIGHO2_02_FULL_41_11 TaxID=1802675 RepID=A0A1F8F9Z1_9BACT|nr:MAG: hypothetical protein A3J46_04475 [Candidatus Yanofskybacteria bacterium RIFCSPHIGHO2_02_FULL_41_11]